MNFDCKAMNLNRIVDSKSYTADDMPVYPARTLMKHCAMKGLQMGSVFGVIAIPVISLLRRRELVKSWKSNMPFYSLIGVGVGLSALYGSVYYKKIDVAGVDDRAYRIIHNKSQNEVDGYSHYGAIAGATLGILSTGSISVAAASAMTGIALGVISYSSEKYYEKQYGQKLFDINNIENEIKKALSPK